MRELPGFAWTKQPKGGCLYMFSTLRIMLIYFSLCFHLSNP
jgi:hypothetical protein